MRVVVTGYIVRGPLGGMVWSNLQYLMGFAALGHDVLFVEDSDDYESCYDPGRDAMGCDPAYGLRFAAETLDAIGFGQRWAYHDNHQKRWYGPAAGRAPDLCARADILVNLCGVNPLRPWLADIPRKVYVDQDPVFTQVRNLSDAGRMTYAKQHDVFFTFAANFGDAGCTVPDDGLPWRPTRQPVVLNALPRAAPRPESPFTTVMNWDSYRGVEYAGRRYGTKGVAFGPYMNLPGATSEVLELAVGGPGVPREALSVAGWRLRDPREPTQSVARYLDYVRSSKAEWSIAKDGYVASASGWFSERSTAYLATGRPVVVQDTGFTTWLPAGEGVLAFGTPQEALAAIDDVATHYADHCAAARALVESNFDARRVLADLIAAATAPACA